MKLSDPEKRQIASGLQRFADRSHHLSRKEYRRRIAEALMREFKKVYKQRRERVGLKLLQRKREAS